jgi:flagellar biosynthetic protein FliQ
MTTDFVSSFFFEAMKITVLISSPVLLFGLFAGVIVSIFQAATQINEMTLVFIPKMLAVGLALLIFFPWMLKLIVTFTQNILTNIPMFIK